MIYSIRKLGDVGMVTDAPGYELPENAFTWASNMRFFDGTASNSKAASSAQAITGGLWMERLIVDDTPEIAVATATALYMSTGGVLADCSNPGGHSTSTSWQSCVWGEAVIFNNGIDPPQIKRPTDATFIDLPNWPATWTCKVIRKYKSFLVALGVTKGAVLNESHVVWSTEAADDDIPSTWDETDTTELAGFNPVSSSVGAWVDCLEMGDANILYSRQEVWAMQFIGAPAVFQFTRLFRGGLICPNAVAEFDGKHFVVADDSIYAHDGASIQHVADNVVKEYFFTQLGNRANVQVATNPLTKEVWVKYATNTNDVSNEALIFCYQRNTATIADLAGIHCLCFGALAQDILSYSDLTQSYKALTYRYADMESKSYVNVMYQLSGTDVLVADNAISDKEALLERTGLDFDQMLGAPTDRQKHLSKVWPQIVGSGTVLFQFGMADSANGAVEWDDPVDFDVAEDVSLDTRITGRYLAWRMIVPAGIQVRITGMDIELRLSYGR